MVDMLTSKASLPLFLGAEALSLFGNSSIAIVLPWLVLSRTGDPSIAGLVAAIVGVPTIVASLVGGWLIDKVGQRRMSVLSDLGSAVSVAALAVVDRLLGLDLGWFVALGVLGALFDVPGMTARETLMARVSRTSGVALDRIAGIRQGVFGVAFLAGPALAGVLLSIFDPIQVVWVTATCSALAAGCTLIMPLVTGPEIPADHEPAIGGFAMVRRSPTVRAMLIIGFASTLVTAPLIAVLLPAHFQRLAQPDWFGYTMSAFALGSIAGSILYALISRRSRRIVYVAGLLVQTVGMAGFATLQGFWLVAVGAALVGLGSGLLSPIFLIYFSERIPEAVRGRVLGLFNALSLVATPIGLGGIALILTSTSLRGGALIVLLGTVVLMTYALASPSMRRFVGSAPPVPTDAVADTTDVELHHEGSETARADH